MEILFSSDEMNNYIDVNIGSLSDIRHGSAYYKMRMIQENNIPYMLKPVSFELDGNVWLRAKTGGAYILERVLNKLALDGAMLRLIVLQLCECISRFEMYLLSADDIVLDPKYIFYRADLKNICLLYIPEYGVGIKKQIKQLLEFLMRLFDHRDRAGIIYLYKLYDVICDEAVSMADFRKAALEDIESCVEEPVIKKPPADDIGLTSLIPLSNGAAPELSFADKEEKIVVGRGRRKTDYRLSNNQVSRIHARIYRQGKDYIIEDVNSTNGTYINSERLLPNEKKMIHRGDIIAFANEEFFVK